MNNQARKIEDPCSGKEYRIVLAGIKEHKAMFLNMYTLNPKKAVDSARKYLIATMADTLFSFWENTAWEFYGNTEIPQCGSIACGYFVTTLLRDLGFNIPRIRWAKAASETFISEFCDKNITKKIGKTPNEIFEFMATLTGIYYLVGLDTHVGIIEIRNGETNFLHSAEFINAHGVTREPANGQNPFSISNYRVFGELFTNRQVVSWIQNTRYP